MSSTTTTAADSNNDVGQRRLRILLGIGTTLLVLVLAIYAGLRQGLLLAIGLGFGITLEGLRFGFAGPWRQAILQRNTHGLQAQLLAIGLTALPSLFLLEIAAGELIGATAPVGVAMIFGAFVFGAAMQVVLGCGSGTLVNAGSGNLMGLWALPFFIAGSFLGTLHLPEWHALGQLPPIALSDWLGTSGAILLTLAILTGLGWWFRQWMPVTERTLPRRLWIAALCLAGLAVLNLLVAGQPWGVVYGLGLWGAKLAHWSGMELAGFAFWSGTGNAERLTQSLLLDITSVTDFGLLLGAGIAARWKGPLAAQVSLPTRLWIVGALAALLMGYASRLAYGCNVGAFFSGISTGSLHGWVWFIAAFAGSLLGVRLRNHLLEEKR